MISTTFSAGAPTWIDLGSTDVDASTAFYTGVFGWTAESAGPDTGGYGFFLLDGKMVGGYGPVMEPGDSGAWTPYFGSNDVEATGKAVEQAGGTARTPVMDVMEFGRMAQFTDPTGGKFAIWEPKQHTGFGVTEIPGSVSWVELHTTDAAAAIAFYHAVLGWTASDMPMGPGMDYTVLSPAGTGPDQGFGGIMAMDGLPAVLWRPYFETADCDATLARAVELGATPMMAAETVPGVGRMAELVDPLGSRFAIITGENRPG